MILRSRYIYLALTSLALLIYLPVITGEIIWVDDVELLASLGHAPKLDLVSLFIPNVAGGLYYRPVTIASYILNWQLMWQATEWMHVVNILIHAGSAMLCFLLLVRMTADRCLSLVGAALFLVHPLATESVCWISGRTDLLAGLFLLGSTWFLISYRETSAAKHLLPSLIFFLLAVLSKEFALAFVPGMLLIMYNKDLKATHTTVIRVAIYSSLIVGLFFLLRSFAFSSSVRSIKNTLVIMQVDYWYTMKIFMQTTAFYLKKIIVPYPLNFSIEGIHFVYSFVGLPLLLLLLIMCFRFTLAAALFSSGLFLMAPSLLIAFGQIAWTPYAERYAYIPSLYIIMSAIVWLSQHKKYSHNRFLLSILGVLIIIFGVSSFQRSSVWQIGLDLAEDTLQKNADSKILLTTLGEAYLEDGKFDKAEEYLKRAEQEHGVGYYEKPGRLLAKLDYFRGNTDAALVKIDDVIMLSKCKSTATFELKLLLLAHKVSRSTGSEKREYLAEKLSVYNTLFKLTKSPKYLYLMGTHSDALGDVNQGRHYFEGAAKMVPVADPLHQMIQQRLHALPASGE